MTGIPRARTHSTSAVLVAFLTLASVGGVRGAKALAKSADSAESVATQSALNALRTSGLQLSGDQRTCVVTERAKEAKTDVSAANAPKGTAPVDQGSGFTTTDKTIGAVLRCISQDQAIGFVAGSLDTGPGNTSPSSAFLPVPPGPSSKQCLIRRLRVATWPEVSEVFRSNADVILNAGSPPSTVILASRLQPYIRTCAVLKDAKGITPLPTFTIGELRVRWNAAIQRHGASLAPVSRWATAAEVGLPGAPVVQGGKPSSPSNVAVVALNSWVAVALDDSSAANVSADANVSGATIVLEPPTASESVASEALYVLADAIDGRDQAITVRKAFDLRQLFASGKVGDRQVRIGRTIYVVSVAQNPVRVFVSAFPS